MERGDVFEMFEEIKGRKQRLAFCSVCCFLSCYYITEIGISLV